LVPQDARDSYIAEIKSSHREALAKSSNPLNLGKTRWEEEENTGRLHGKASKPEEEVSGGLRKRESGGNDGSGAGEVTGGDLDEAAVPLGSGGRRVNEGNR
jgi:hypothetical protein